MLKDRLISKYSIILASAELTRDKLGIQFKLEGMKDLLISHYNSLLEEHDMGQNAYELIMSWLVKNYNHIILGDYLPALASVDGIFLEGDRVALLKSSFEKMFRDFAKSYCSSRRFEVSEFCGNPRNSKIR